MACDMEVVYADGRTLAFQGCADKLRTEILFKLRILGIREAKYALTG